MISLPFTAKQLLIAAQNFSLRKLTKDLASPDGENFLLLLGFLIRISFIGNEAVMVFRENMGNHFAVSWQENRPELFNQRYQPLCGRNESVHFEGEVWLLR